MITKKRILIISSLVIITILGICSIGLTNLIRNAMSEQRTKKARISKTSEITDVDADLLFAGTISTITSKAAGEKKTDDNLPHEYNVVNILLIGQDTRDPDARARSDSMILCSINMDTDEIKLTSFMRDMYVHIPGYGDNRINAAYAFGGMPLLDETLEENFGVKVDGNIEVDFFRFVEAMSAVGDLEIELNEEEANYLNKNHGWNLTAGMNTLNAEQVLAYSRIRYVGNNDYERTERQRRVLITAFSSLKDKDLTTLVHLADEIIQCLETDMTKTQLLEFVYTAGTENMKVVGTYRIPADGTFYSTTIDGMSVLVPDLEANRKYLKETGF